MAGYSSLVRRWRCASDKVGPQDGHVRGYIASEDPPDDRVELRGFDSTRGAFDLYHGAFESHPSAKVATRHQALADHRQVIELARYSLLRCAAKRAVRRRDTMHERRQLVRLDGCAMVRAGQSTIGSKVLFHRAGTERCCSNGGLDPQGVIGKACRQAEFAFERAHGAQIDLLDRRGIAAHAVQEHELGAPRALQRLDRACNLPERTAARLKDRSDFLRSYVLQQGNIGDLRRADLYSGHAQYAGQDVDAVVVERRA